MVQILLRNKEDNYDDYEATFFERYLSESFDLVRHDILLSGNRVLYFAHTKS